MDLVTGATGHIGNVLVRALLAKGREVRAFLLPGEDPGPLAGLPVEIARGDVRDPVSVRRAASGAETVYHLAGLVAITPGRRRLLREVNVGGVRHVVEACLDRGVRRLVHVSSVHALVEPPRGRLVDEELPVDPARVAGAYAKSKALGTLEVRRGLAAGLDAVIAFPTGVVGPYDFRGSEMGRLVLDYAAGRLPAYVDGGYDFVDVRDVAAGLIAAAERGRTGEGYLLAGEWVAVRDLLGFLAEETGARPPFRLPRWLAGAAAWASLAYCAMRGRTPRLTPYALHTLRSNSRTDAAKARSQLGFTARPFRESIRDTVNWFRETGRLRPTTA
ncbi:MAG: SDR family oxidoreductase [Bacteroidota bacterium]